MANFKLEGYEEISEEGFFLSCEVSQKRNEVLRYLMDKKKSDLFNELEFVEALMFIDMGFMMMEKALFVAEGRWSS